MRDNRQVVVRLRPHPKLKAANQNDARPLRKTFDLARSDEPNVSRAEAVTEAHGCPSRLEYMPRVSVDTIAMWISDQVRKGGSLESSAASRNIGRLFGVEFDLARHGRQSDEVVENVLRSLTEISCGSVSYCLVTGRFQAPGRQVTAT